jgi:CheY-like chemotaxis protein/DNA-binding XRE family transcriptional regulator
MRLQLGISQEELAERADLHRTYIAGIERGGRNITLRSVDKLAKALRVSVSTLLSDASGDVKASRSTGTGSSTVIDILLVEDNPSDAALTARAFAEARIINPVHTVRDGQEALDFLFGAGAYANRKGMELPQVILLDLNLPKVSGIEVLRRIKRDPRTRQIAVIVLTVSNEDHDIRECKRLGAENYIVKPVGFQNFSQITPQLSFLWALLKPGSSAVAT